MKVLVIFVLAFQIIHFISLLLTLAVKEYPRVVKWSRKEDCFKLFENILVIFWAAFALAGVI